MDVNGSFIEQIDANKEHLKSVHSYHIMLILLTSILLHLMGKQAQLSCE